MRRSILLNLRQNFSCSALSLESTISLTNRDVLTYITRYPFLQASTPKAVARWVFPVPGGPYRMRFSFSWIKERLFNCSIVMALGNVIPWNPKVSNPLRTSNLASRILRLAPSILLFPFQEKEIQKFFVAFGGNSFIQLTQGRSETKVVAKFFNSFFKHGAPPSASRRGRDLSVVKSWLQTLRRMLLRGSVWIPSTGFCIHSISSPLVGTSSMASFSFIGAFSSSKSHDLTVCSYLSVFLALLFFRGGLGLKSSMLTYFITVFLENPVSFPISQILFSSLLCKFRI